MRRIRIAAASLMVSAGLIGAGAAPASALSKSDSIKPALTLCTAQGGTFAGSDPGVLYFCQSQPGQEFSNGQLRAARAVCERAYAAFETTFLFVVSAGQTFEACASPIA
jgi:hypothetical protein